MITLLDRTNDNESEEFHKNLVSNFLKDTYYKQNHFINTKGHNDLVINNGQNVNSTVVVIHEAKKQNPSADTTDLENQIDQLVYQFYELTEEEIKIVEGV